MIPKIITNKVSELLKDFLLRVESEPEKAFLLQIHGRNGKVTGYKTEENAQIK